MTAFNLWAPQGTVTGSFPANFGQPNVLFETGSVIIGGSSPVFKMWYDDVSTTAINYAESSDGVHWTQYASNPVIAGKSDLKLYKNAGTYYAYCGVSFSGTLIDVYTSTDGVTFTLAKANALLPSASGWDNGGVEQLSVLTVDHTGKWWAYYTGWSSAANLPTDFCMGLVNSTDGINWTRPVANPPAPTIPYVTSNFTFAKVNGIFYGWSQQAPPQFFTQGTGNPFHYEGPSQIFRFSATNPGGPWTPLTYQGAQVNSYYAAIPADFYPGSSLNNELGDPCILAANGNLYLFYSSGFASTADFLVNLAIATNTTFSQLVGSYEGVLDAPFSGTISLNLNTLALDNFTRANANPIGGNWTPLATVSGFLAAQLASNLAEPSAAGNADSWWNALTWGNDQWSEVTVAACVSSYVGISLRQSTAGAVTAYRLFWNGTLGASGTWTIQKVVANTFTTLASGSLTLNAGDSLLGVVVGSNLLFYWNGYLFAAATDSAIASGAAGFMLATAGAVTAASINSWKGGQFQGAPPILTSRRGTRSK
jgi:hypothetical protein